MNDDLEPRPTGTRPVLTNDALKALLKESAGEAARKAALSESQRRTEEWRKQMPRFVPCGETPGSRLRAVLDFATRHGAYHNQDTTVPDECILALSEKLKLYPPVVVLERLQFADGYELWVFTGVPELVDRYDWSEYDIVTLYVAVAPTEEPQP